MFLRGRSRPPEQKAIHSWILIGVKVTGLLERSPGPRSDAERKLHGEARAGQGGAFRAGMVGDRPFHHRKDVPAPEQPEGWFARERPAGSGCYGAAPE